MYSWAKRLTEPQYVAVTTYTTPEPDGSYSYRREWDSTPTCVLVDDRQEDDAREELRKRGYRRRRSQWLTLSSEWVRPYPLWLACVTKDKAFRVIQSTLWFLFKRGLIHKAHPELRFRWRDLRPGRAQ
jgi:hypothetical protein